MTAPDVRAEVVRLYQEGKSLEEVGAAFGRSLWWALAHLRAAGVPRRSQGRVGHWSTLRAPAVQLYSEGKTTAEVADALGVTPQHAVRLLRGTNVAAPPQGRPRKDAVTAAVAEVRETGCSQSEAARRHGVTSQAVHYRIRRDRVKP